MRVRKPRSLPYTRCRFATQLPISYHYSTKHFWIRREQGKLWRVGLTKFGTRLLGEIVEHRLTVEQGATVVPGQVIGWIEGFKAVSELSSIAQGRFAGHNAALDADVTLLNRDPYGQGWIYAIIGEPDKQWLSVKRYVQFLNQTIDHLRNLQSVK